ncbi:glycosyltransferase [Lentzea sp. NPDC004789]
MHDPEVELVLRGVLDGDGTALVEHVRKLAGPVPLRVVARPHSADAATPVQDLHQSTVVAMPSRAEGFGLAGLEAIALGVPTLVSKRSGLGALLEEERNDLSVELTSRLIPVTDDEKADTLRWGG